MRVTLVALLTVGLGQAASAQTRDSVVVTTDPMAGPFRTVTLRRGTPVSLLAWSTTDNATYGQRAVDARIDSLGTGAVFLGGRMVTLDSVARFRAMVGKRRTTLRDGAIGLGLGLAIGLGIREALVGGRTFQTQAELEDKKQQLALVAGAIGAVGFGAGAWVGSRGHDLWVTVDLGVLRSALQKRE